MRGVYFILAGVVAGLIAIGAYLTGTDWLNLVINPIPALLLGVACYQNLRINGYHPNIALSMLIGFVFCSLADLFITLNETGKTQYYLLGMVMYMLTYLSFIVALTYGVPISHIKEKRHWGQLAFAAFLVVLIAEVYVLNYEYFGAWKFAFAIYGLFLLILSIASTMRMMYHGKQSYFLILAGTLMLTSSDLLVILSDFSHLWQGAINWINPAYYLALILIALGFSLGKNPNQIEIG